MATNTQPPESVNTRLTGDTLDVHSVFLTLQGEGPFSGRRSVFVRLAGCNLQCPGCDTEYTQGRHTVGIDVLAEQVRDVGLCGGTTMPMVVITGGEPLRQPIGKFVLLLAQVGVAVQIESNGSLPPDEKLQVAFRFYAERLALVVSPKTKSIHPDCHALATAFKYVLDVDNVADDGLPTYALHHEKGKGVARPRAGAPVYVTPMDTGNEVSTRLNAVLCGQAAIKHGYIAGLQIHKHMMVA